MRRFVTVASAGALAFLTGGCSYFSFLPWVDSPDVVVIEELPADPSQEDPTVEGFVDPLEEGQQQQQPEVTGLLVPTKPQERLREIDQGREDPFSIVPSNPIVTRIPVEVNPAPGPVASLPQAPAQTTQLPIPPQAPTSARPAQNPTAARPAQTPTAARPAQTPTAVRPAQNPTATQPSPERQIPRLPSNGGFPGESMPGFPNIPQPSLARGVGVSGVIQVGNVPKAIIRPANLSHSIYVEAGEYISNGRVLVKRIEMRNRTSPTVVFEENGVEFARQVGTTGEASVDQGPTAFLPPPPVR